MRLVLKWIRWFCSVASHGEQRPWAKISGSLHCLLAIAGLFSSVWRGHLFHYLVESWGILCMHLPRGLSWIPPTELDFFPVYFFPLFFIWFSLQICRMQLERCYADELRDLQLACESPWTLGITSRYSVGARSWIDGFVPRYKMCNTSCKQKEESEGVVPC